MNETTQICVGLDNKPGELARLCRVLRDAAVNIEALCVTDDADCVWVNIVTNPADVAERVLSEGGYRFFTEKVLVLKIANQPGELEGVAAKLAEAKVNINYVYGAGV
ncbi:MAG: amino acid-binding protein, partial [Planctomycetes bacterium]|nr:amino acid-binding protein [Planctomycetota bacterium]